MTKEEAINAMRCGEKVKHRYFAKGEWITMRGNMVVDENGNTTYVRDFFAADSQRSLPAWDDGYSIVGEQE